MYIRGGKEKRPTDAAKSFCRGMNTDVNGIPLSHKINVYNMNKATQPTKSPEKMKVCSLLGTRISSRNYL